MAAHRILCLSSVATLDGGDDLVEVCDHELGCRTVHLGAEPAECGGRRCGERRYERIVRRVREHPVKGQILDCGVFRLPCRVG